MPKKVAPTKQQFAGFDNKMHEHGFLRLAPEERERDRIRLGLEFPNRPQREPGMEVGYYWRVRELTLKLWSTWLIGKGAIREHDQGWVLIARGDAAPHFEHPFNRTAGYLERLFFYAQLNQERLLHRPICDGCGRPAQILKTRILTRRTWGCQHIQDHPEQDQKAWSFNFGVPLKMIRRQQKEARRQWKYWEKREEQGKPNHVAMLGRKKATVTRREHFDDGWGA